jgi:hypothetical protein
VLGGQASSNHAQFRGSAPKVCPKSANRFSFRKQVSEARFDDSRPFEHYIDLVHTSIDAADVFAERYRRRRTFSIAIAIAIAITIAIGQTTKAMQIENRIVQCNEKSIRLNLFVMNKSIYIWIGPDGDESPSFGSLVTAIQTKYEPMPTSKTLLSAEGDGQDESIETGIS